MRRELAEELRRQVILRAKYRCEYCLYPESRSAFAHQIDHIVSRKHGGDSALKNLAYCCVFCHRYKGSDVAAIDDRTAEAVTLFNPRRHLWPDHFSLYGAIINPMTPEGRVTGRRESIARAAGFIARGKPLGQATFCARELIPFISRGFSALGKTSQSRVFALQTT